MVLAVVWSLLIIYGSMFFIGVPANGFLIWVFFKMSKKRRVIQNGALRGYTSTDLLLLSMAVIDFLACLIAPLQFAFADIRDDWVCKFTFFTSRVTCLATLFVTVALAIYRHEIVVRQTVWSRKLGVVITVCIMCVALAVLTHGVLLIYARQIRTQNGLTCSPFGSQSGKLWIYRAFVIGIFFLCLAIVCAYYGKILWFLKMTRKRNIEPWKAPTANVPNLGNLSSSVSAKTPSPGSSCSNECRKMLPAPAALRSSKYKEHVHQQAEVQANLSATSRVPTVSFSLEALSDRRLGSARVHTPRRRPGKKMKYNDHHKATKMILLTTLIIYLAWMPYILTLLLGSQIEKFLWGKDRRFAIAIIALLTRLRDFIHVVNVFVYIAANARFRKNCKEILGSTRLAMCLKSCK